MVNGKNLIEELKRIDDFFDAMSVEEFERIALDCGAGVIVPRDRSKYVEAIPKRYVNIENMQKNYLEEATYTMSFKETEAA